MYCTLDKVFDGYGSTFERNKNKVMIKKLLEHDKLLFLRCLVRRMFVNKHSLTIHITSYSFPFPFSSFRFHSHGGLFTDLRRLSDGATAASRKESLVAAPSSSGHEVAKISGSGCADPPLAPLLQGMRLGAGDTG